jgi:hypothetical protein
MYYVAGGMPESVLMWTEARDVLLCRKFYPGLSVPMSGILPGIPISVSFRRFYNLEICTVPVGKRESEVYL